MVCLFFCTFYLLMPICKSGIEFSVKLLILNREVGGGLEAVPPDATIVLP